MSFITNFKNILIAKKWFFLSFVLLLAIGTGGFFGFKHYKHLNSPEFFIEQLNLATQNNDFVSLASMVDFRGIAENISKQVIRSPIPSTQGKKRETNYLTMSDKIQSDFILSMQNKDKEIPKDPKFDPLSPLEPLPKDFAAQISGKFSLQAALENEGIISVTVNYPRLEKDYKLLFTIKKNPDWMITHLKNADELISEYIAEENKLEVLRDQKFQKDNSEMRAIMKAQFDISQCTAFVHTTSDGQSTFLVRINGYNKGPHIIRNMSFETNVIAHTEQGDIEIKRDLNMATRLLPGVDLVDSYNVELDPNNEQDAKILEAKEYSCTARIRLMTLGNGKLLFTKRHRLEP